ncbi:MAG: hypothetical protein ACEY3F_07990 [Wolbachia sp.]
MFHVLTGCDYNPAFYRKGKLRPFKILKKSVESQTALAYLNQVHPQFIASAFRDVQNFVCCIYGFKSKDDDMNVNNARSALFFRSYKVKDVTEPFAKNH